jgi:hypothetical protein
LKGSIKKWEDIVNGTDTDKGSKNCPLCAIFYKLYCDGCPVSEASGNKRCDNTPYEDWINYNDTISKRTPFYAKTTEEKAMAQDELDFLKSLLPPNDA